MISFSILFLFFTAFSVKTQDFEEYEDIKVSVDRFQPLMDEWVRRVDNSSSNSSSLEPLEAFLEFRRLFSRFSETLFKTFFAFISETLQKVSKRPQNTV